MENNKTLRKKYSNRFENIYESSKKTDAKLKYHKYNFQPYYIYEEIDENIIVYYSYLEEHYKLHEKVIYLTDLTSIFNLKKLKKFLDENKLKKTIFKK